MSCVFEFEAPKGQRILSSRFMGITNYHEGLWWSYEHKKWLPMSQMGNQGGSSSACCRSFKAFKKHLQRHPELKSTEYVVLVSRFVGYSIIARWEENYER